MRAIRPHEACIELAWKIAVGRVAAAAGQKAVVLAAQRLSSSARISFSVLISGSPLTSASSLQSAVAPESLTALDHFCTSSLRKAANSPGVLLRQSRPSCERRSRTSGAESARVISELSRLTRSCGTAAGAKNAVQVRSSKPEKPCSFTVGTSGSAGERRALDTAIARTLPARACGTAGGIDVLEICVCPATAAPTACAGWYGTWVMSSFADILIRSIYRCVVVPMPEDA